MALQLDGSMPMPLLGGYGNNMGTGAGALGGGAVGLLAGLLLGNGGLGNGWGNRGGSPAADAAAASVVLNPAFQSLQNQVSTLSTQVAAGDLNGLMNSEFRRLNSAVDGNSANISNSIANLSTAQATQNFTTLTSINDLGRDIQAQSNQNALQQLNSFNNLTTTTLQGFNNSAMQIQNSTNQIIAQGTANAAAVAAGFCNISKEMAECCCDIKGAIAADGSATRALINDLNVQSLRDQLAAAQGKVSNNEQNQYLLNTILTHIKPTTVVA